MLSVQSFPSLQLRQQLDSVPFTFLLLYIYYKWHRLLLEMATTVYEREISDCAFEDLSSWPKNSAVEKKNLEIAHEI